MKRPCRLNLPCAIEVRTSSTFAPSSFSTARLTSILVASDATSNTSVRPASRSSVVFSVISGRRMMSVSFMVRYQLPVASCQCEARSLRVLDWELETGDWKLSQRLLQLFERLAGRDDARGVHHVARRQPRAR